MTHEKLRYVEQLLIKIHKEGLIEETKKELELYFEENYGENALVKPEVVEEKETRKIIKNIKGLDVPEDMQEIIARNIKKAFGG